MCQILALASLGAVARHQDICLRHHLAHHFSDLRIGCPDHGSHIAVAVSHALLAPFGYHFSYMLIERTVLDPPVLELPAGRVGGLYKDEDSLLLLLADLDERIDPVGAQIGIDRGKVFIKGSIFPASHPDLPQMPDGIGRGGRADIPPLDVADDYQIL